MSSQNGGTPAPQPEPRYSELRQGRRVELADVSPLPSPFAVYVEPTNVCNLRCSYCPESFDDYKERSGGFHRLDLETFARVSEQVAALGRLRVLHFYMMGEPFLNRELPEFVKVASTAQLADRICVTTNATVMDANSIERILDSGLDYLRVSVYGATGESYERRTGVKTKLARVIANVTSLKRARDARGVARPFIYVKTIDTGDPVENDLFKTTFEPISDEVAIEPVMNWNDPVEGNLAQVSRVDLLSHDYFRHKKKACAFPFYTLVIHSDLRVSACCVDWAKEAIVGDLKTESLAQIWSGDRLHQFRLAHPRGERETLGACARCTYLYTAPDSVDALSAETYLARCAEKGQP